MLWTEELGSLRSIGSQSWTRLKQLSTYTLILLYNPVDKNIENNNSYICVQEIFTIFLNSILVWKSQNYTIEEMKNFGHIQILDYLNINHFERSTVRNKLSGKFLNDSILWKKPVDTKHKYFWRNIFSKSRQKFKKLYKTFQVIFVKLGGGFTDVYFIIFITIIKALYEYYILLYVRNILEKNYVFKNQSSCFVLMYKQLKKQ